MIRTKIYSYEDEDLYVLKFEFLFFREKNLKSQIEISQQSLFSKKSRITRLFVNFYQDSSCFSWIDFNSWWQLLSSNDKSSRFVLVGMVWIDVNSQIENPTRQWCGLVAFDVNLMWICELNCVNWMNFDVCTNLCSNRLSTLETMMTRTIISSIFILWNRQTHAQK